MSGTEGQSTTQTTTEKTFTQKDIEAERAHAQHFKQELDGLRSKLGGKDIESILQRAARAEELENAAAGNDPKKWEDRLKNVKTETEQEITKRFSTKLEEAESKTKSLEQQLNEFRIVTPGLEAATKVGFLPEASDEVKRELKEQCRWDEEQKKVIIIDKDGKPRYKASNPAELMTQEDLLKEIGTKKKHWLQPTVTRGTHTGETKANGSSGGATVLPSDFAVWTQAEQTKFFRDNPEIRQKVLAGA